MSLAIASRYARALADLAFDPKNQVDPDVLANEVAAFVTEYEGSAALREIMATPAVALAKKRAVAAKIADVLKLSEVTKRFLFVVIEHGRMRNLKLMHSAFLDQVDARRGVVKAEVFSAQELGESERALLESGLAARTSLRIRPEYKIDTTLLGGVLVRMGSTVYDGSVRGMLAGLAAQAGLAS